MTKMAVNLCAISENLCVICGLSYLCPMNQVWYGEKSKFGVLGGGQLGRMLIQEALNYDVHVHCLDQDPQAPCRNIASTFTVGSLQDFDTVYEFGKDKHVLTVEIEHVNIEALEKLEAEGVRVYPQPRVLRIVQDKGLQKEFYVQHNIPTPAFELVANKAEIDDKLNLLPVMQKMRKGGYDGKGVTALRTSEDLQKAFDVPSVLESFVDFEKLA
jgi:5-(carboxyamino)imidazole ribonucleotide synthase